jgi:hypothetical protein
MMPDNKEIPMVCDIVNRSTSMKKRELAVSKEIRIISRIVTE